MERVSLSRLSVHLRSKWTQIHRVHLAKMALLYTSVQTVGTGRLRISGYPFLGSFRRLVDRSTQWPYSQRAGMEKKKVTAFRMKGLE